MTHRGNRELAEVLAAAGSGLFQASDERELARVLAVFKAAGDAEAGNAAGVRAARPGTRGAPVRPRRTRANGRLAVQCATGFLLATGCGVVAASAGVLPTQMQQFAHEVLGGMGVPGPGAPGPGGGSGGTGTATAAPSVTGGSPSSSPTGAATLVALCGTVAHDGNDWRSELSEDDQAALIAAAGSEQKVVSYCARLLAGTPSDSATPSAGATSDTSTSTSAASASPDATTTHGNAHATHSPSPNPHSTGH